MKTTRKSAIFTAILTLLSLQSVVSMDILEEDRIGSNPYKETPHIQLPQINIDDFDPIVMSKVFLEHGTFELVGPTIEKLSLVASLSLKKTRELLNLPIEILERIKHEGKYHGFEDLKGETLKMAAQGSKVPIRNQIAFHLRPYCAVLDTGGVDIQILYDYYTQGIAILRRLYQEIGKHFIDSNKISNVDLDESSMLTARRYYECKIDDVGSPTHAHTDYGLLTLAISDQPGLEVLNAGNWFAAACGHPLPRFYINPGDMLRDQVNTQN